MYKPEFYPIELKRALRNHLDDTNYLVYKNEKEFVKVKAGSAFEALEISKVTSPLKIVHLIPDLESFLQEQDLKFIKPENNSANASPSDPQQAASEPKKDTPDQT